MDLTTIMMFCTALLPVVILLFYIYRKDNRSPEPAWQLVKGFLYGVLSVPLSLCLSVPFGLIGLYVDEPTSVSDSIRIAFLGAAIPEECAKLFMLWLLLRKNRYFDEKMDGIVYAVCVTLGFAALENVMYVFGNYNEWLSTGIVRALFAVPGHFIYGILMGYYYSMVAFYPKTQLKNKIMVLVAPIIAHGIYDSILFVTSVTPAISGLLTIVFLVFCHNMWKYGSRRIHEHLERDGVLTSK